MSLQPVRTLAVMLLCLGTLVSVALGFTNGMVLCRDADGCVAVEVAHDAHQGCHADPDHAHDGDRPAGGHEDGNQDDDNNASCSDASLAAQRPERLTTCLAGPEFLALNLLASSAGGTDLPSLLPILPRASAVDGSGTGIARAEAIGLCAIVLLA